LPPAPGFFDPYFGKETRSARCSMEAGRTLQLL
jgi:hypothetical protein